MKLFVPTCFFLLLTSTLFSQDLTGIWRGSFYNIREVMLGGTKYRYEVQLDNNGKGVKGVTYSYQTTRFYGKASLVGMWTSSTSNLILKEEKMEELKIDGGGEGCLMTCYLDYHKEGDKEYLEGNYSSRNMNTGADCGGGRVYLERVVDTDFEKEDFLKNKSKKPATTNSKVKPGQEDFLVKPDSNSGKTVKKEPTPAAKKPVTKTPPKTPSTAKKNTTTKPATKSPSKPVTKSTTPPKPKPSTTKPPVASSQKPSTTPVPQRQSLPGRTELDKSSTKDLEPNVTVKSETPAKVVVPPPPVLKQRKNELFQTIYTSASEIAVSFYDNGEIDGDTITVYDNNKLLVSRRGLSAQPILVKIKLNEEDPDHDIVMVAENLGSIPPNTALMIVEAGKQRYTVRLSSTEQKNAMVRFRYKKEE